MSIAVSDAHVYTGRSQTEIARGTRSETEFPPRLRLDVLIPEPHVGHVVEVLDRFATGPRDRFVQDAYPAATVHQP